MNTNDIEIWLANQASRERVVRSLLGSVLDSRYRLTLQTGYGGGSWCAPPTEQNKEITIRVGLPEWLSEDHESHETYVKILNRETVEADCDACYWGLATHELAHAALSRLTKVDVERIIHKFPMKDKTPTQYQKRFYHQNLEKFIHSIAYNCMEDAHIENIIRNIYNVGSYLDFLRITDYMAATESNGSKSFDFFYAILQLGTIGKYPIFPLDAEAVEAIESIMKMPIPGSTKTRNLYYEFLCEPDPVMATKRFVQFFDVPKFHDYVAKLIYDEIETHSKEAEALSKLISQMPTEIPLTGKASSGSMPLILPSNIEVKIIAGEESDEKKSGNGNSNEKNDGNTSEDQNSNGSGNGSGDEDSDEEKSSGGSNGTEADDTTEENGSGNNGGTKGEEDANSKQSGNDDGDETSNSQENGNSKSNASKSNNAGKVGKPSKNNTKAPPQEGPTFDQDGNWQLNQGGGEDTHEKLDEHADLRDALNKACTEIASRAKAAKKISGKSTPRKTAGTYVRKVGTDKIKIDTSFKADKFAPSSVVTAAKPLRAVLKKLVTDGKDDCIFGLKSGTLDVRSLYKVPANNPAVFKKKTYPAVNEAVYYICWDGSGSMYGDKQQQSGYACAVIEEAVRGIYPLKVINFSTCGQVVHYVVKDFDEKTKRNCSYSFAAKRSFSGGNKDGYSIRQCTEELMHRREPNKFLIVLSDGAPSDYDSHAAAVQDVKEAVAYARAHKIDVTSIFFGSAGEREREIDLYNEMYGEGHIISCEPEAIVNHLVKIVKKNIFR